MNQILLNYAYTQLIIGTIKTISYQSSLMLDNRFKHSAIAHTLISYYLPYNVNLPLVVHNLNNLVF